MIRSKLSTKAVLLAAGIGLSTAAFVGSQPVAAQSYTCPAGTYYDLTYGCTGDNYDGYYGGYYSYPTVLYGQHSHHGFGHTGIGADGSIVHHGMGFHHSISAAHFGGAGFADRGVNVAHLGGGGFAHGMGVAHVGGFGGHGMGGGLGGGGHR